MTVITLRALQIMTSPAVVILQVQNHTRHVLGASRGKDAALLLRRRLRRVLHRRAQTQAVAACLRQALRQRLRQPRTLPMNQAAKLRAMQAWCLGTMVIQAVAVCLRQSLLQAAP